MRNFLITLVSLQALVAHAEVFGPVSQDKIEFESEWSGAPLISIEDGKRSSSLSELSKYVKGLRIERANGTVVVKGFIHPDLVGQIILEPVNARFKISREGADPVLFSATHISVPNNIDDLSKEAEKNPCVINKVVKSSAQPCRPVEFTIGQAPATSIELSVHTGTVSVTQDGSLKFESDNGSIVEGTRILEARALKEAEEREASDAKKRVELEKKIKDALTKACADCKTLDVTGTQNMIDEFAALGGEVEQFNKDLEAKANEQKTAIAKEKFNKLIAGLSNTNVTDLLDRLSKIDAEYYQAASEEEKFVIRERILASLENLGSAETVVKLNSSGRATVRAAIKLVHDKFQIGESDIDATRLFNIGANTIIADMTYRESSNADIPASAFLQDNANAKANLEAFLGSLPETMKTKVTAAANELRGQLRQRESMLLTMVAEEAAFKAASLGLSSFNQHLGMLMEKARTACKPKAFEMRFTKAQIKDSEERRMACGAATQSISLAQRHYRTAWEAEMGTGGQQGNPMMSQMQMPMPGGAGYYSGYRQGW